MNRVEFCCDFCLLSLNYLLLFFLYFVVMLLLANFFYLYSSQKFPYSFVLFVCACVCFSVVFTSSCIRYISFFFHMLIFEPLFNVEIITQSKIMNQSSLDALCARIRLKFRQQPRFRWHKSHRCPLTMDVNFFRLGIRSTVLCRFSLNNRSMSAIFISK